MGSCVSVHKDPGSSMKLRFTIGSKNEKILIPSPVNDTPPTVNAEERAAVTSLRSPARYTSIGSSKEEVFFDSQPWLESDCEDDFVSVNGDLSSSCGNTPAHPNSSSPKMVLNKLPSEESNYSEPQQSQPDRKMRLSELFKDSLPDEEHDDEAPPAKTTTTLAQQLKSTNGTPDLSRGNSEGSSERASPDGEEEKPLKRSPQCCLPKLLSSGNLNDRKKRVSPARGC